MEEVSTSEQIQLLENVAFRNGHKNQLHTKFCGPTTLSQYKVKIIPKFLIKFYSLLKA